jgi:chemotaxis protein methyltransferase CheR
MAMTAKQFDAVRDLIYKSLGLQFDDAKIDFMDKRVEKRMTALRIGRVDDYVFHLRFLDADGAEMQALANLVTTNETYMFREFEQLQAFADWCLPEAIERREKSGFKRLRIWSAGCSSGEEAYTLAIILREVMHDVDDWDIRILATDIDEVRLRMARDAVYGPYAVREVPDAYAKQHLIEVAPETYRIHPDTARFVEVRHTNLHDRHAMRTFRDMDFVFCRNVLIYFDDISRKAVVDNFYGCLNPGGFLYLGHSESVSRISAAFTVRRIGPHLVYCREP